MQKKNHPQHDIVLQDEPHPKQDFQVERIAFFSDAVFAIAITLLIIEFHPPHVTKDSTAAEVWHEVKEMKFKFAALVLSFVLVVGYWMRHHLLFKHIHNYNKRIIVANMALLLPIIFFPFTTSFLYESIHGNVQAVVIPYRLFMLNNVLAGALTAWFYWLVIKKYKACSYPMKKEEEQDFIDKTVISTICFILVFIISFYSFEFSPWGILPFAIYQLYRKNIKKFKKTPAANVKQTGGPGH
jgi:uncharacterized membrane protein